jgi:cytochrome b561
MTFLHWTLAAAVAAVFAAMAAAGVAAEAYRAPDQP